MSTTSSTTKRRAAVYLRISLDQTGEGLAIDRQGKDAQRLARQRGWKVVETFTDTISASGKKHRPAFAAMLDAIGRGDIDAVIAYKLDRLARNARDRLAPRDVCQQHGAIIAPPEGSELDPTTANGRLLIGILRGGAGAALGRKS